MYICFMNALTTKTRIHLGYILIGYFKYEKSIMSV